MSSSTTAIVPRASCTGRRAHHPPAVTLQWAGGTTAITNLVASAHRDGDRSRRERQPSDGRWRLASPRGWASVYHPSDRAEHASASTSRLRAPLLPDDHMFLERRNQR